MQKYDREHNFFFPLLGNSFKLRRNQEIRPLHGIENTVLHSPSDLCVAAGTFSSVSVLEGIPFIRYSTARSGLLKLARNAASTYK